MTATIPADPFVVNVSDAEVDDLNLRLREVRWPNEPDGNELWDWGTNLTYMERLVQYWRDDFDWRAQEAKINRFPHFLAEVTGENGEDHHVHFIYEKGSGSNPQPIILTHGWPSTFFEFMDVIEPLAHPERFGGNAEEGLDVIVPSCLGFGFSSKPRQPIGAKAMAYVWDQLMRHVLGFDTYLAQGGDLGASITSQLGLHHAAGLKGIHLTTLALRFRLRDEGQAPITEEEIAYVGAQKKWWIGENAYQRIQGTKPMALAFSLMDSPVGLAAWLAEKYRYWVDIDRSHMYEGIEARVPFEQILTQISIFWFTGTINSANMVFKAGNTGRAGGLKPSQKVTVPTGFADYPYATDGTVPPVPRSWAERGHNIVHYAAPDRGGHFAAMTEPKIFAEDLQEFVRTLNDNTHEG